MKPMLESINLDANASLKIEAYLNDTYCESAGWHVHPEYEMVYVKNGAGQLNIGAKKRTYTNGVLVFLSGHIPHADFGNKDNEDNLEIVIQFKKEFLEEKLKVFPELGQIMELVKKSEHVLIFDEETHRALWDDFRKFENLDYQGKLINLLSVLDFLSKKGTYEQLFETFPMDSHRKDEIRRLEEIFEYVNNRYSQNISIGEISAQVGLTPNSFCRFFKKMTKRTFIGFVNEFRTGKAVEFFNESNSTVTDVMYRSGFNDPSYFSRQFKKYQGNTPSLYLKSRYGS
ncbi:AraC family transcriptional regulator [Flagellimonas nanhaiensis]|uniref:AraC family transcriptional regulator n=1 Tax=Flagellimonas nanhaiensis TaxID=2292706 RepID=A0A371JM06_9FLAO|nr:AraC family transcriptional regulator [Allomuricauda nanhaiensis]RDY58107.1 AraC family transcriptional regulator [Allomuricauda nanhaiensis]